MANKLIGMGEAGTVAAGLPEDEATFIEQAGAAFSTLVKGVKGFLLTAKRLEDEAAAVAVTARGLAVPTSPAEDEDLQRAIKETAKAKKAIDAHWSICATVHALHRRLTARREKGIKCLDEAQTRMNQLHNTYVRVETEKAQREQDRLRAEAETRAQAQRQVELDRLEALALASESTSESLSAREETFVLAIVAGETSYAAAARVAGYKDPDGHGRRLMMTEKIQVAIKARHEAFEMRRQLAAVKAEPLAVTVVEVKANVTKAAGTQERTTRSLEVFDVEAWRAGVLAGTIPADTMIPSSSVLNQYARALGPVVNRWPGCRLVEKTQVV